MKHISEAPASLTLLDDPKESSQTWPLSGKSTYRLGREAGNDITLPFSWVSRKHAMIQVEENGSHNLIDLGSANGTLVNGKRIYTPTALHAGDIIKIGNTSLSFFQKETPPARAAILPDDTDDRTVAFVRKETVTILICDIHNFTRLSETVGDKNISKLLGYWTVNVADLVRKHDGIIDKFIGDAVMALWAGGSNLQHSIHQALTTALKIDNFTRSLGKKVPEIPWQLDTGAALNTGEAMVGNLGVDGQRDFTVIGDVVNVAFRLEEKTSQEEKLDVIMGSTTATYLKNAGRFFTEHEFSFKGKEEAVKSYGCSFKQLENYLLQNASSQKS